MDAYDAPDPRDIYWKNIGADRLTIESRNILVQCILLLGILGWGTFVTYINKFTLMTLGSIPLGLSPSVVQGELIQDWFIFCLPNNLSVSSQFLYHSGYLPALVVSLILLWMPNLFYMLGMISIFIMSFQSNNLFSLLTN